MKTKKGPINRVKWWLIAITAIVIASGVVLFFIFFQPIVSTPCTSVGYHTGFTLPSSYHNFHCVTKNDVYDIPYYSWQAYIRFDMSPEDLDFVLSQENPSFDVVTSPSTDLWDEFPRSLCGPLRNCGFESMESYVYAIACCRNTAMLINTSHPEYYRVYLSLSSAAIVHSLN